MKSGDQKRIIEKTGFNKSTISNFFNHPEKVNKNTKKIILQVIKELGIDYKIKIEINPPIHDLANVRWDIYNNLPYGALTKISNKVGCSAMTVSRVLDGKTPDRYNVIKEAELLAAINIWKTRFCKHKSQL